MKTISKEIDKYKKEISWTLQGLERNVNVWIPLNQLMRFEDDEMMDIIKTIYNETATIDIDPKKGNTTLIGVVGETIIDLGEKKAYVRFIVTEDNNLCIDTIESKSKKFFIDFLAKRSSNLN